MRILVVTQYFWPENFRINQIVEFYRSKNYIVDVLTGYPNYPHGYIDKNFQKKPQKYNSYFGANIFRVPVYTRKNSNKLNLFLNYLSFILSGIFFGFFKLRNKNYDLVFTHATSPLTVGIVSIFFSKIKKSKHILWVLDFWPQILKELKVVNFYFFYKCIELVSSYIYKKTDLILVQSLQYIRLIKNLGVKNNVKYLPSWPEYTHQREKFKKKNCSKKFKIVFTGNVGEAQNFDNVLIAAHMLKDEKDLQWEIIGTGRKILEIKKKIKDLKINNFLLKGHHSIKKMPYYISSADVLLVSLKSGEGLSATIPGKVQTYLQTGKFILGFLSGAGASVIIKAKSGCVVDPDSPGDLCKKIIYLKKNKHLLQNRNRVLDNSIFLNKYFNKNKIFTDLNSYLEKLYSFVVVSKKLVTNAKFIPFHKNFCLSGLNLAFIGYYCFNKVKFHKNLYLWPDGIFSKFISPKKIKKYPGRQLLDEMLIPNDIKNIYIFGNSTKKTNLFLASKYNKKIIHVKMGYENAKTLYKKHVNFNFKKSDMVLLTLPTPKQEIFAELISRNQKFYKVLSIGGAANMNSKSEPEIPFLLDFLGMEFIWRLRNDTRRRIKRLLVSFFYFFIGSLSGKISHLQKKVSH